MDSQQSFYHTRLCYAASCSARPTDTGCFGRRFSPSSSATSAVGGALLREQRAARDRSGAVVRGHAYSSSWRRWRTGERPSKWPITWGWKYALDLELPYEGFHPTVLVYFRDRLEENQAERVIFDGIVDLWIELGLIMKAKGVRSVLGSGLSIDLMSSRLLVFATSHANPESSMTERSTM